MRIDSKFPRFFSPLGLVGTHSSCWVRQRTDRLSGNEEGIGPLFRSTFRLNFDRSVTVPIWRQQAKCSNDIACTVLSYLFFDLARLGQVRRFRPVCFGYGTRIQQEFLTNSLNLWRSVRSILAATLQRDGVSDLLYYGLEYFQNKTWFSKLWHKSILRNT